MQDLSIGVPLHNHVRHRDLNLAAVHGDPATNSGHSAELHLRGEAIGGLGNYPNIWCAAAGEVGGGEVVEPEDAADAGSAVVDDKFEIFFGFEVAGDDRADGLGAGEEGAVAGEGDGVGV